MAYQSLWDPVQGALRCGAPGKWARGKGLTLGPQGPDQSFLVQEGLVGLPRAAGPHPGHFGMRRPGEGGPRAGDTHPKPSGARLKLLDPGAQGKPPQG